MLSVLINTYNRPERLERCLEAIVGQGDAPACETIVVDDGGEADLGPVVARFEGRMALRLERIAHAGRAAARNRALELAAGSRVLFLGDDVLAGPGLLARHAASDARQTDPAVAVVGPYPLAWRGGSPPLRRWAEPNPQHLIKNHEDAGPFFFATGNLSADRARLIEIGGFDERFAVYGWEDIDLGLRFRRAGGRIVFDPEAAATHDHGPMGRGDLWRRERQMGYTAWQFAEKWRGEEPAFVKEMQFWDDPAAIAPPSALRRCLGEIAVAALDALAPNSALNWKYYERLVFSYRLEGVAEAWRTLGGG
jgi:GT2 family glycosyltransferase